MINTILIISNFCGMFSFGWMCYKNGWRLRRCAICKKLMIKGNNISTTSKTRKVIFHVDCYNGSNLE